MGGLLTNRHCSALFEAGLDVSGNCDKDVFNSHLGLSTLYDYCRIPTPLLVHEFVNRLMDLFVLCYSKLAIICKI